MRDLVYYIATSLDGFIAAPDGDFSMFPQDPDTLVALFERYPETCPAHVRPVLDITAAPRRFDTVIMGFRSYAPALAAGLPGGAYPHLEQYVVTHRTLPDAGAVHRLDGDLAQPFERLKAQPGKDIWLCGGADVAAQLADQIDELQFKVNPVVLGAGIPVLPAPGPAREYQLVATEPLPGGVVLLTYRRR